LQGRTGDADAQSANGCSQNNLRSGLRAGEVLKQLQQTVLRVTPLIRDRRRYGHIHYFTKETALQLLIDLATK